MKNWIFFDVMGVVFEVGDDTNDLLVPFIMERNKQISKEKINEFYMEASLGKISSDEFWEKCGLKNSKEHDYCKEYLDSKLTLDPNFIPIAKKLSEKYNIGLLSNDVSEWSLYLREKYGINSITKINIISGDVNFRKPSKKIYEIAIEKSGEKTENIYFIDDRDKNLVVPNELGMNIIRFNRDNTDCKLPEAKVIKSLKELDYLL